MVAILLASAQLCTAAGGELKPQILTTPAGVRFGISGAKPRQPAPTLVVLATSIEDTLGNKAYLKAGNDLAPRGFLLVSIDLPCHGQSRRSGEAEGLHGWRLRLDKGKPLIDEINRDLSAVLDFLIAQRYTDPKRIAACGTSRGGFAALHFAAHDARVRCVAAYSPVTDLAVLREFTGSSSQVHALALVRKADALAGRPIWIMIGDDDGRVSTDKAIAFARALSHAAYARKLASGVELHVMPVAAHSGPPEAGTLSAAWIHKQLENP